MLVWPESEQPAELTSQIAVWISFNRINLNLVDGLHADGDVELGALTLVALDVDASTHLLNNLFAYHESKPGSFLIN